MSKAVAHAVQKLLRPLIRLLLRHGVAYEDFDQWVKQLFVQVADKEFALDGRKQSVARISTLTGINRKEVKRLQQMPPLSEAEPLQNNRAARVVSGWMRDEDFLDEAGKPLVLSTVSADSGFSELVRRYSGDVPARAILDELLRVGVVARVDDHGLKLMRYGYIPQDSDEEMLRLFGESTADLLDTIHHNLVAGKDHSRLQLSVAYDDLPKESVEIFRRLSRDKSYELLGLLNQFLSTQDRTSNPNSQGTGRYRAGLGLYYFEQNDEDGAGDDG